MGLLPKAAPQDAERGNHWADASESFQDSGTAHRNASAIAMSHTTSSPKLHHCGIQSYDRPHPGPMGGVPNTCKSVSRLFDCRLRDGQTQARHKFVSRERIRTSREVV